MIEFPKGQLPILPIKNSVLFPSVIMPLMVSRTSSIAALDEALTSEDKFIAIYTQKDPGVQEPNAEDLHEIGTLAIIKKMARIGRTLSVEVQGISRIKRRGESEDKPFLNDKFEYLPELPQKIESSKAEALYRAVIDLAEKMLQLVRPDLSASFGFLQAELNDPVKQIYLLNMVIPLDVDKEIALLSADSQTELFELMHSYLEHEVHVLELRNEINKEVATQMDREQREYFLRKQLRMIQDELGEERPELADVSELRQKMKEADLPEGVDKVVSKELDRMERMSSVSPDYQLTRTYVELALELPWNNMTKDLLDLDRAQKVLDEDHFDLLDVKQRILEHLAVMKLNPEANAPILCLVGPPGVGKTSVGKSVARAMGRKFERMSLGGLHDEAELRGHRRTYIGAMPGQIILSIRRAGVRNPILMLDEVDKLGRDFRGDPAAALMEILDPAQNIEFHDNYLDMPFDLSKVFFIVTANTLENIPGPLLDRMEVLRLAGYTDEEKLEIAHRYLIPRRIAEAGLKENQLPLSDKIIKILISRYTREAGVRELERTLGRLARKIATRVARDEKLQGLITEDDLPKMLGPETFRETQTRKELGAGVAAGLAWTQAGGDVLYVEATLLPGGKNMMLTGQLGDVMQESAKAARSYIWSNANRWNIDRQRMLDSGVHIHVPSGAVPKDGPSAGVTMLCALVSAYTGIPIRSDTAMTGEITLSGLVLPVGGVKEKVLAAYRSGIQRVILPDENKQDIGEIPEHVIKKTEFVFVNRVEDVITAGLSLQPETEREMAV